MNKKTIVVLFGGQSSEHEVSRVSASTIISNISQSKYYVIPVGITKEGRWMIYNGPVENIKNGEWEKYGTPAVLSPDATQRGLIKVVGTKAKIIPVDVVIPVLHGKWGEDGTVQGLLELAQIPYVGCGVLSSSVSMDKVFTKIIAKNAKITQAEFVCVLKSEIGKKSVITKIEKKLGYPCFIKPANAGSSVGITKAHNQEELIEGLKLAAEHDRKILVEEFIDGRELECAVLGSVDRAEASTVGEILAAAEFYDYDAKYNNAESKTVIPAELDEDIINAIRKVALKVFRSVDGSGLARVDFFLEKETNRIIFNELNTLPGFTAISMYPKLWEAVGKPLEELIDELISLACCGK
ncbi:D-alanine--D-alanine ligase [Lachnospiraceae bacterium NSJ-143]|nr:D-alanine--D-alanine ligase [Lachnospiraceae bacterium NSJ-143]